MNTTEKLSRYKVLADFSLGLEATASIQHANSEVDLTDAQAAEFAEFVELIPELGPRNYVVVKKADLDGKTLKIGERIVLDQGQAALLGDKVVDVEDELDEKERVKPLKEKAPFKKPVK